VLDSDYKYTVAILPFLNLSERKYAGEIVAFHFLRQITPLKRFNVVEPGAVRQSLLGYRMILDDGISLANTDIFFSKLDADLILSGKVFKYQDAQGGMDKPIVDFSATLIERQSREVVWSFSSYHEGDEGVFFFDLGKLNTAYSLATEMVKHAVEMIAE
jgi:hypothetical protein